MIDRSCAFTSHRPHKFPWKYDEADSRCIRLKTALLNQIVRLMENGVTRFFSGMAEGVDCWAARAVLDLRIHHPELELHCILPCGCLQWGVARRNGGNGALCEKAGAEDHHT